MRVDPIRTAKCKTTWLIFATFFIFNWRSITAGQSSLPLNDVNIVILTDVHSWVAGHGYHEPNLNADYGHVLSFYQHLQKTCELESRDLFFVMNGDFMDGTALSNEPPSLLIPILEKMPWDAVNMGNHELYEESTIDYISAPGGFVDQWNGRYITSNIRHASSGDHVGARSRFIKGTFGNVILTFGFLYDMTNQDKTVLVDKVENVVKESWFIDLLQQKQGAFDAILILAHMDVEDPLVSVILQAIRNVISKNVPVQFVTGHTHYRGFANLDELSVSFEAGRYLDTVGFVSFSKTGEFQHRFLDANIQSLAHSLNIQEEELMTSDGQALSDFIYETQEGAGLLDVIACSPENFYLNRSLDQPDSLFGLYLKDVVPNYLFGGNSSKILIQSKGDFRYDLFSGNVTITDLTSVYPFHDKFYSVAQRIDGLTIESLLSSLNLLSAPPINATLPNYLISGDDINANKYYDIYTIDFQLSKVTATLESILSEGQQFHPEIFNTAYTPHILWIDFMRKNWFCPSLSGIEGATRSTRETVRLSFAVILLGGGSLLFVFVILKFAYRRDSESKIATEVVETYNTMEQSPTENRVV